MHINELGSPRSKALFRLIVLGCSFCCASNNILFSAQQIKILILVIANIVTAMLAITNINLCCNLVKISADSFTMESNIRKEAFSRVFLEKSPFVY